MGCSHRPGAGPAVLSRRSIPASHPRLKRYSAVHWSPHIRRVVLSTKRGGSLRTPPGPRTQKGADAMLDRMIGAARLSVETFEAS